MFPRFTLDSKLERKPKFTPPTQNVKKDKVYI